MRKMVAVALSVGILLPNQGWSEEARRKDEDVSKEPLPLVSIAAG